MKTSSSLGAGNTISASLRKLKAKVLRFQPATIHSVDIINEHFRLISLSGDVILNSSWAPGQKVEIVVSEDVFSIRTYTPISWNRDTGIASILVYLHGDAPGANWAERLTVGESFSISSPRDSIDLSVFTGRTVFFGDETSIGLAKALLDQATATAEIHFFLEVSSPAQSHMALAYLGLDKIELIQKLPNDAHLDQTKLTIMELAESAPLEKYIFTGCSSSIRHVTKYLKSLGVVASMFKVRAYWTPGKTGLD